MDAPRHFDVYVYPEVEDIPTNLDVPLPFDAEIAARAVEDGVESAMKCRQHRLTAAFELGGTSYPEGSLVLSDDQGVVYIEHPGTGCGFF